MMKRILCAALAAGALCVPAADVKVTARFVKELYTVTIDVN